MKYIIILILILIIRYFTISYYVLTHSKAIEVIKIINRQYLNNVINKKTIHQPLKSLKTFKNYNPQLALLNHWNENYISETFNSFKSKNKLVVFIKKEDITGFYKIFASSICKNEQRKYNKTKNVISVKYSYTSPKGQNHYRNTAYFSVDDLYNLKSNALKKELISATRANERALLTSSMRYDVLKRDNFQCQLCGHTKDDGVKLHVDHIKPIAKGGKTQMSNLRTLCEDCNLGKSDKYVVGEKN